MAFYVTIKMEADAAEEKRLMAPSVVPPMEDVSSAAGLIAPGGVPLYLRASAAEHEWVQLKNLPRKAGHHQDSASVGPAALVAPSQPLLAQRMPSITLLLAVAPSVGVLAAFLGARPKDIDDIDDDDDDTLCVLVSIADAAFLRSSLFAGRVVGHAIDGQAATDITYRVFADPADAAAYSDPTSFAASHARHRGVRRLPPVTVDPLDGPVPQDIINAQAALDSRRQRSVVNG
jgi:hypothetical protein